MTENAVAGYLHHAVVVGVDGSTSSSAAIRAAAWEAQERGRDLVLAHGYAEAMPYLAYGWSPYVPSTEDVYAGRNAMLAEAAAKVRQRYPDIAVHTQLLAGSGAGALIQLSETASLVVVGSRGDGGFGGLSIGSTAAQAAAYARCPVMVIRPDAANRDAPNPDAPNPDAPNPDAPNPDEANPDEATIAERPKPGPVLVGIAGSVHDEAALRFAFEEASLRRTSLVAAHVWWYPPEVTIVPERIESYDNGAQTAQAERVVAEAIGGWSTKYPDIAVEQRTIQALNTSYALIEESVAAGLVVVGCRGRGGFAGLVLGSVSRDLVGHSLAPVAVIHDHA